MAKNKIPVLTEVYQPKENVKKAKQDASASHITPTLIAELREDIKKDVLASLQIDRQESEQLIVNTTKDFIDKTKADFKTELPAMYHESVNLAEIDLVEKFSTIQNEAMTKFSASLSELSNEVTSKTVDKIQRDANAHIVQEIKEKINGIQSNLQEMALAQINQQLTSAIAPMMDDVKISFNKQMLDQTQKIKSDFLTELNAELPEVQQVLSNNVEKIVENTMPIVEEALRQKLREDILALLLDLKFVLP